MLRHLMISLLGVLVALAVLANSISEPEDPLIPVHPVPWDPMLEEMKMQHETLKCIKEALETQNEAVESIVETLGVIEKKVCRLADRHAPDDGPDDGPDDESKTEELLRMQLEVLKWIKEALTTPNDFQESVVESLETIEEKVCRLADEFAPVPSPTPRK